MKLPPFASIEPQLATLVALVPRSGPFVYELKYDGYRAMAWLDHGKATMASRRGGDWTRAFREIARAVSALGAKTAILDGEVAYVDETGRTNFQKLQGALGSTAAAERSRLVYYVFDLLHLDGVDLRAEPLSTRKELLRTLLAKAELPIRMSDDLADGQRFFEEVCKLKLEGIIGKRSDRPYTSGRSLGWIKIKCKQRQELIIVGYTPQKDLRSGLGALLMAAHDEHGTLRYAGKVGSGFSQQTIKELVTRLKKLARKSPPLEMPSRVSEVRWVEPVLVAEVEFTEWTTAGILRQPTYQGLREDKDAADVVFELPA